MLLPYWWAHRCVLLFIFHSFDKLYFIFCLLGGKVNFLFLYGQLEFHIHHAKEPAKVSRILSVLDPKTGKVTKKSPRCLTAKQSAVIEVNKQSKTSYFNELT